MPKNGEDFFLSQMDQSSWQGEIRYSENPPQFKDQPARGEEHKDVLQGELQKFGQCPGPIMMSSQQKETRHGQRSGPIMYGLRFGHLVNYGEMLSTKRKTALGY